MPTPPTIAEREAELAALQSAFDEYITSSRELEEELDAELAKMQEKLAQSSAANAALSSQLENMAPQLGSLEKALTETRANLEKESLLRRQAESSVEDLESKCRECEGALLSSKEECDAAHEELAFAQSELEEARLELEVEQERHKLYQEEYNNNHHHHHHNTKEDDTSLTATDGSIGEEEEEDGMPSGTLKKEFVDADGFSVEANDDESDDYVKRLEDELELVTEQLIDTERTCTDLKLQLENMPSTSATRSMDGGGGGSVFGGDASSTGGGVPSVEFLQEQLHQHEENILCLTEELELAREELTLTQEELRAAEEDATYVEERVNEVRQLHKVELDKLGKELESSRVDARTSSAALDRLKATLVASGGDAEKLRIEIDNLNRALELARKDAREAADELEQLYEKFDDAKAEAHKAGRQASLEEGEGRRVKQLQQQVSELTQERDALLKTPVVVASSSNATQDESSTISQYKKEMAQKDAKYQQFQQEVEARLEEAEAKTTQLEKELTATKGKLYEAEATLIIAKKNAKQEASPRKEAKKTTTTTTKGNTAAVVDLEKFKSLESQVDDLKQQNSFYESRCKKLEEQIKELQKQIGADGMVTTDMSRLSSLAASQNNIVVTETTQASNVEDVIAGGDVEVMAEELRLLDKKSSAQRDYNAQLLSKILSLQGNIQVCCRIRPINDKEVQAGQKNVIEPLSEAEMGCFDERNSKWKSFHFDKVWGPDQSQSQIFSDVEPLALSVVDGYNACIFAYGQTGSGKTYTMEGTSHENSYGISYRTIQKLFSLLQVREQQQRTASLLYDDNDDNNDDDAEQKKQFTFRLNLGMLEIYNDEIFDLLAEHASAATKAEQKKQAKEAGLKATLDLKRSAQGKMEVPGLTKEPITCLEDVFKLLKKGNANRATAATNLNEHSSRSHMVLTVDVESGLEGQPSNKGVLYLVDLAGSERVAKSQVQGAQLKEAAAINKSLSALGNVMEALDRKSSHVPYRDSKLTHLLQDAIGGNSRTMMVVAVCPTNHDESVHALQFATRVRRIQRKGPAQRNVVSKNLEETVKALTQEMKTLSKQKEQSERSLTHLQKDNTRIQEKLQSIASQKRNSQTDHKTLELLRKNNTDMAARWNKEKALRERQATDLEKARTDLRKKQSELGKVGREKEMLERQLHEKQQALQKAQISLKEAKDAGSAATLRARKTELLLSKAQQQQPGGSSGKINTPRGNSSSTTTTGRANNNRNNNSSSSSSNTTKRSSSTRTTSSSSTLANNNNNNKKNKEPVNVEEVRQQVLALLEKHDPQKVERLDIIMEKFKGKEALLVDKMRQRYEGASYRSELALKRHQERMQRMKDKK